MEKFNLKIHNQKAWGLTKKAAAGTYPSKKIAKAGSYIGSALGLIIAVIGVFGLIIRGVWGIGCTIAGVISIVSNVLNIKRNSN
jgi:hypothetical protein